MNKILNTILLLSVTFLKVNGKNCVTTGSANNLCLDEEIAKDLMFTAEYKEYYKCYNGMKSQCVENDNGECEWQYTDEMKKCVCENEKSFGDENNLCGNDKPEKLECVAAGCGNTLCVSKEVAESPIMGCMSPVYYPCYENQESNCVAIDGKCQWDYTEEMDKCICDVNKSKGFEDAVHCKDIDEPIEEPTEEPAELECVATGCGLCISKEASESPIPIIGCLSPVYTKCLVNQESNCVPVDGQCQWVYTEEMDKCLCEANKSQGFENSPHCKNIEEPAEEPTEEPTEEPVELECVATGCGNALCVSKEVAETPIMGCMAPVYYPCYENQESNCVAVDGKCQWEYTEEMDKCLCDVNKSKGIEDTVHCKDIEEPTELECVATDCGLCISKEVLESPIPIVGCLSPVYTKCLINQKSNCIPVDGQCQWVYTEEMDKCLCDADKSQGFEDSQHCKNIEEPVDDCWSTELGYDCCSTCKYEYIDDDGYWGIENNKWCGVKESCNIEDPSEKIECVATGCGNALCVSKEVAESPIMGCMSPIYYPCYKNQESNCVAIDGKCQWAYTKEMDKCLCKVDKSSGHCKNQNDDCWSIKLGYKCCSKCKYVLSDDDGIWGVEHGEWCGVKESCNIN